MYLNLYVYMYVCVCVCVYIFLCQYTCTGTYICIYIREADVSLFTTLHTCTCMYKKTCVCIRYIYNTYISQSRHQPFCMWAYVYVYVHMYMHIPVCMCMCICIFACVYTRPHSCTHTLESSIYSDGDGALLLGSGWYTHI